MNNGLQLNAELDDTQNAYNTFEFYARDKKMFGIKEIILVDEDALKMVTA